MVILSLTRIVETIIDSFDTSKCERLDVSTEKAIRVLAPSLSILQVAELAENNLRKVSSWIDDYISEYEKKGVPAKFNRSLRDPERLVGRCFVYPDEVENKRREKCRLAFFDMIWDCISQELTDKDFEQLCGMYLKQQEFEDITNVGKTRDGGIDLRAILRPHTGMLKTPPQRVVCQAKRYKKDNKIGIEPLRALVGAEDSDIYIFMTTSTFTSDAKDFEQIILVDGEQITWWIIKEEVGFQRDSMGNLYFSRDNLLISMTRK